VSDTNRRPTRAARITDEDIETARFKVARAIELTGAVGTGGRPACPACGEDKKGKTAIKSDKGYFKCHKCGHYRGAINLMTDAGFSFVDAVNLLLDREVSPRAIERVPTKVTPVTVEPEFSSEPDPEVFTWIAKQGDKSRAVAYYARWHIAPAAVREAGCFYLPLKRDELVRLQATAIRTFGAERLVACGVATPRQGTPRRAPSNAEEELVAPYGFPGMPGGYPVGEPHVDAQGLVSYCQYRPDGRSREAVEAHKAGKRAKERAESAGESFTGTVPPYQPPFLSMRGLPHAAMIGGGVWRLSRLEPGATVVVVEGIKDLLAARTMGAEAYALPGAQTLPPPEVCELLARHKVRVAFDGDEAGLAGRELVLEHLREQGVRDLSPKEMPDGKDVTDILVARHVATGCTCQTCAVVRSAA
jgi:hypothetical protein